MLRQYRGPTGDRCRCRHRTVPCRACLSDLVGGPACLDLDREQARLFCACDGGKLFSLDARSGKVLAESDLTGVPDVVFFNAGLKRLYVAIGDPGVIDVIGAESMRRSETVRTERGAHTIGFDAARNKVYAFLPGSHRAAVYVDE